MSRQQGGPAHARTSRIASLDGIRALAVLAVVGFHFGLGWLPGGFFGVDVFYVLSGFLITGLLLAEWRRSGGIRLSAFWLRRARRLLPCLVLVVVAVSVCVRYLAPTGTYPGYRMDALSALFYFSNWWQIHTASDYFVATGAASPLTHTWSLAIEEQFYLVWPIVVLGVLRFAHTYGRAVRTVLAVALVGAAASAVEMALLYRAGASTTRLYFGTDTHAQCVLVGAALASAMALVARRQGSGVEGVGRAGRAGGAGGVEGLVPAVTSPVTRRWLGLAGLGGLAGLVALSGTLTGSSPLAYEGGFAVCAVAAAAMIAAAACLPRSTMTWALSLRPLVLLGVISYGVYLWHFPVDVFLTPARAGFSGPPLMVVQLALTIALATASYVLVERPIMTGTYWRSLRAALPAVAGIGAATAVVWATTVLPAAATASAPVHRYRPPRASAPAGPSTPLVPGSTAPSAPAGTGPSAPTAPALAPPAKVAVLGDSTAGVLEVALAATAPTGTRIVQGAIAGCGLAIATNSSVQLGKLQQAMYPGCNEHQPAGTLWPARDAAYVAGVGQGDVVLFLAGNWETQDLLMHGHWTDILQPSFRRYELRQLRALVALATAHGAHLDLLTMPAMEPHGEYGNTGVMDTGPPNPASSPRRRALYNGLLQQTAAGYPGKVSVLDYGALLSPHGTFTEYLDGVQIRSTDGVHTPAYEAGNTLWTDTTPAVADAYYRWLSPRIWSAIIDSAHAGPGSPVSLSLPPTRVVKAG